MHSSKLRIGAIPLTKLHVFFRFLQFSQLMVFFSVLGSSPGYHVVFSCHVSIVSSNLCPFLVFPDRDTWKVFLAILSIVSLGLLDVFLWLNWGCEFWGRKHVKCPSHYIVSQGTSSQNVLVLVILTLVTWCRGWLSVFPTE